MTLNEAFAQLITQRGWYKNSNVLQQQAVRDKRHFLDGKGIPEERMRTYLKNANWAQIQKEKWKLITKNTNNL